MLTASGKWQFTKKGVVKVNFFLFFLKIKFFQPTEIKSTRGDRVGLILRLTISLITSSQSSVMPKTMALSHAI